MIEWRKASAFRFTKVFALLFALAFAICLLSGCSAGESESDTRTITDMAGNEVTIPAEVDKYADAWYAHNEVVAMLDDAEGLVATAQSQTRAPWLYLVEPNMENALSTFGDDFNLEELVALDPDLVFVSNNEQASMLEGSDIPVVNVNFTNYEEMQESITLTAEILGGDAVGIAENYNAYLDEVLTTLEEGTSGIATEDKPTVLHGNAVYEFNIDGTNTIVDNWITAAGGINAAEGVEGNQQTVTLEQILAWDPDIIITSSQKDAESIMNDEAWASLSAVQNGQVYVNPRGAFSMDRYGVESALQLQWAAELFHPDVFDFDFNTIIKDFYQEYLDYELTDEQVELILNAQNPA